MKAIRLTLVFAVLAFCILLSLFGAGALPLEAAGDAMKRTLVIVGAIGASLSLVFVILGIGSKSSTGTSASESKSNSGPKF